VVHVLNVTDGNFPSEFATGKAELVEEERRLLYVAMTRARSELHLLQPLKYYVTQQSRMGDRHVYGAKSRFMTDSVMKCCEPVAFGSYLTDSSSEKAGTSTVDIGSRLRGMWA